MFLIKPMTDKLSPHGNTKITNKTKLITHYTTNTRKRNPIHFHPKIKRGTFSIFFHIAFPTQKLHS